MNRIRLEVLDLTGSGTQDAFLPSDTQLTIIETSDIFGKGDVWSYSFKLNIAANIHIFGTSGEMRGHRIHEQINKRRARLWLDGIPFYTGVIKLADEVEIDPDGNVDVSLESGNKTFEDMIEGGKANQVPLLSNILIGLALWRKRKIQYELKFKAYARLKNKVITQSGEIVNVSNNKDEIEFESEGEVTPIQEYPRMVFPKGRFMEIDANGNTTEVEINQLNTDNPYTENESGVPVNPYCNVALCYQKRGYPENEKTGLIDYTGSDEAKRGYEVMPANRVNSAPNFYVLYWIRCLMNYLGIIIDENQMLAVGDLCRLFFVNTNCAHDVPKYLRTAETYDEQYGKYKFTDVIDGRYVAEHFPEKYLINTKETKFKVSDFEVTDHSGNWGHLDDVEEVFVQTTSFQPKWNKSLDPSKYTMTNYLMDNSYLHRAYATSDCFPNADIKDVIDILRDAFGVRLIFDDNYQHVRIVLLRNIFRSSEIQDFQCEIVKEAKVENSIRGFRMTYGKGDDDTTFFYKGFNDKLPLKKELWVTNDTHDYSQWNLAADYQDLIKHITAFDKTCYVTPNNGNAYGIKIDNDAKRFQDFHPSLFEYAGYMDAIDGDCTGEDSTIELISLKFNPAITNDVNFESERKDETTEPQYALFLSDEMKPRRVDLRELQAPASYNDSDAVYYVTHLFQQKDLLVKSEQGDKAVAPGAFCAMSDSSFSISGKKLRSVIPCRRGLDIATWTVKLDMSGYVSEGYRLYLQDNFSPDDDGISPIEKHDWGVTLGIMRGTGSDASVNYAPDDNDNEGNNTWDVVPGSTTAAHPDTCDSYGKEWDYNGSAEGIGSRDGRISLKLRAEKPNPYFDPSQPEGINNRRYLQITNSNLQNRGLADQFYKEYSYWVRNARIAKEQVWTGLTQLRNLDKTKKVKIGDKTGLIKQIKYTFDNQKGLGVVDIDLCYL